MSPTRPAAALVFAAASLLLAACEATDETRADRQSSGGRTWAHAHSQPWRAASRSLHRPNRPAPHATQRRAVTARGWVRAMQLCISHFESHGNLLAHNPEGPGYWGRYQFEDGLFHGATGLRGHASSYSAAIQDRAFLTVFDGGRGRHRWANTYAMCRTTLGGPA